MVFVTTPITGKEARRMRYSNQGRFRQQVRFLRRQFLQDGNLPFTNVLSDQIVSQALTAAGAYWVDRIYSPLVTLWVFLERVLKLPDLKKTATAPTFGTSHRKEPQHGNGGQVFQRCDESTMAVDPSVAAAKIAAGT
jgi:hypothetical protein